MDAQVFDPFLLPAWWIKWKCGNKERCKILWGSYWLGSLICGLFLSVKTNQNQSLKNTTNSRINERKMFDLIVRTKISEKLRNLPNFLRCFRIPSAKSNPWENIKNKTQTQATRQAENREGKTWQSKRINWVESIYIVALPPLQQN